MTDTNSRDPSNVDAYAITPEQFEIEWRNLGKSTPPEPVEHPRDEDGRFSAEPLGDAYKMSDSDFNNGWNNLGRPTGDGHPLSMNRGRLAEIRKKYSAAETNPDPNKKETA